MMAPISHNASTDHREQPQGPFHWLTAYPKEEIPKRKNEVRLPRLELGPQAWEAYILPLNYSRVLRLMQR